MTLPWWQFLLLLLLSFYALIKLLVLPLLQGFIYRRSVATQKTLGEELDFGLPAYALASRQIWLDRLMNDSGGAQGFVKLVAIGDVVLMTDEMILHSPQFLEPVCHMGMETLPAGLKPKLALFT